MENIEFFPGIFLSQSLKDIYEQAKELARNTWAPILILGEKGTGKELLAKSVHYFYSSLRTPFLALSCKNLTYEPFKNKLEHYCSVISNGKMPNPEISGQPGKQGTIFLRAVENVEAKYQGKIYKLLQETCYKHPNSSSKNHSAFRLIFSHNQNTENSSKAVSLGGEFYKTFRPHTITIMPLRERKEDIPPLAHFFVDLFSKEYKKDICGIQSETLNLLQSHGWPGNVSELKDVIENAVLLAQAPLITKDDIRFNISKKFIALESSFERGDFFTLAELERVYILTILRKMKNNKSRAAKILGISRNTLQKRLASFTPATGKKKVKKETAQQLLPF
jgi:DNA-binding NtrC family response regulator